MGRQSNSKESISWRARQNMLSMCKSCGLHPRYHLSGLCGRCSARRKKFGLPNAAYLPRSYYAREWGEIKKFIKWFDYHPAIIGSLQWFDAWLRAAQFGKPVPGAKAVGNLADRGCTGEMALQEVLSVVLYASRRQTPATSAPFLIANAFLRSAPGSPRGPQAAKRTCALPPKAYIGFKERKEIANAIRETLRGMFFQMLEYFKRKDAQFNEQVKALDQPFPVLLTKRQHADLRCRAMREKEGSKYIKRRKPNGEETKKE